MDSMEILDRATQAINNNDFATGANEADKVITTSSEADELGLAWFLKGRAHEGLGKTAEAVDAYREAVKLAPSQPKPLYSLSSILINGGQFSEGLAAIKKAIELDPAMLREAGPVSLLSSALNEVGDARGALDTINDAIKENPSLSENSSVQFQKGYAHNSLGEREDALRSLDKAAEGSAGPGLGIVRLQQGLARQALNEHEEAVKLFAQALELITAEPARAWIWIHTARSHVALQDQQAADEALAKATDSAETSMVNTNQLAGALLQIAVLRLALKEYPKSLEVLTRAEKVAPDPSQLGIVILNQGIAQQNLAKHDEAVAAFEKARDLMPPGQRGFVFLYEAISKLALNDRTAASEALSHAAKEPIEDPNFFYLKASLLLRFEQLTDAVADLDKATTLNPKFAEAWDLKAGLLGRLGRFPDALAALEKTIELTPNSAEAWDRKAQVLERLQNAQAALTAIEKAIELTPDSPVKAGYLIRKAGLLRKQNPALTLDVLAEAAKLDSDSEKSMSFIDAKVGALFAMKRQDEIAEVFAKADGDPVSATLLFRYSLGLSLLLTGKNEEGIAKLEEIAAEEPKNGEFEAWLICGGVRSDLGQFRSALRALKRAHELEPGLDENPRYLSARAASLLGTSHYQEALEVTKKLLDRDDKEGAWRLLRGIALANADRKAEALVEFDEVIRLAPVSIMPALYESAALAQKGQILLQGKQFDEALTVFGRAALLAEEARNKPNLVVALLGLGFALYGRSSIEKDKKKANALKTEAIFKMTEACEKSPSKHIAALSWWSKGSLLTLLERDEEALLAHQKARKLNPDMVRIHLSVGEVFDRLEDYESAAEAFAEAQKVTDVPSEKSEAFLGEGRAKHRLELYEEALQVCRNAIAANGENEKILELLGTIYMKLNRQEAAIRTFLRGWHLGKPNHRSAALALGVSAAMLAQERNAEARAFLESAEKHTKFSGRLHFNYGVALYRLKDFGGAAIALRKAAQMGVEGADEHADKLEGRGSDRTWFEFWFGVAPWLRKSLGVFFLLLLVISLLPTLLRPDALKFLPWLDLSKDWKVMLVPICLLTGLLLLPILKRFSVKGIEFEISKPEPQASRPDLNAALKAFVDASPPPTITSRAEP